RGGLLGGGLDCGRGGRLDGGSRGRGRRLGRLVGGRLVGGRLVGGRLGGGGRLGRLGGSRIGRRRRHVDHGDRGDLRDRAQVLHDRLVLVIARDPGVDLAALELLQRVVLRHAAEHLAVIGQGGQ